MLKRKFKIFFKQNHTVNRSKNTIKRRRKTDRADRKTITDPPATIGRKRNQKAKETRPHRQANNIDEICFVSQAVITVEEGQIRKN